jgi:DUF4097 and DUF4098 domain-containing protein YvlB
MMFKNKLVISLLLLLVIAGGITFMFKTMDVFAQNDDKKKVVEDSSFTNIEVSTNNAEVVIVPTKSSDATVEYLGASKKAKYNFEVDVKGDILSVHLKQKRRIFFWFGFHSRDLKLVVSVPEKQYENIQVKSNNGLINVENLQAEMVLLETDNGKILLKKVVANSVAVETDNGQIVLDHVEGKIKGTTDNGQISVLTNKLDWPMDLATDNGSIEMKTESEPANATIDSESDNGKIIIFGNEIKRSTYGEGKHLIKLRTDNGSITVTK